LDGKFAPPEAPLYSTSRATRAIDLTPRPGMGSGNVLTEEALMAI
jgi:hypothetical protein